MKRFKYFLPILFAFTVLVWIILLKFQSVGLLKVSFLDVGQGDAIFVETPSGFQMLVDGGPDNSVLRRLGSRMLFYDRSIDVVLLTHPHADHVAGLVEVLKRYRVQTLVLTEVSYDTAVFEKFLNLAQEKNIKIIYAHAGQRFRLGGDYFFDVYLPQGSLAGKSFGDLNEASIVGRLTYGDVDFLLTGDAGKPEEAVMLQSGNPLQSEVLKLGHHGSRFSTGETFLRAVAPSYATASMGEGNSYGHPHAETLALLERFGIPLFRTDQGHDINLATDGKTLYRLD